MINSIAMDMFIWQSQEYVDNLLPYFYNIIKQGYDPNDYCNEIFAIVGCSISDLTDSDRHRLINEIEKYYRKYH